MHWPLPQYIKGPVYNRHGLYTCVCVLFVYTWNHSRDSSSFVMLLSSSIFPFFIHPPFPGASNFNPRRLRYYFFPYIARLVCVCAWGLSLRLQRPAHHLIIFLYSAVEQICMRHQITTIALPYTAVAALNNQSSTTITTLTFDSFYISSIISFFLFGSPRRMSLNNANDSL